MFINQISRSALMVLLLISFYNFSLGQDKADASNRCEKKVDSLLNESMTAYFESEPQLSTCVIVLNKVDSITSQCDLREKQLHALLLLSTVYLDLEDPNLYTQTVKKSLSIAESHLDNKHSLLPYVYYNHVNLFTSKRQYKKSTEYAVKALYSIKALNSDDPNLLDLQLTLNSRLADNYISLGDYSRAFDYLKNSELQIKSREVHYFDVYDTYDVMGYLQKEMKEYANSEESFLKAESALLSKSSKSDHNELLNLWLSLADLYIESGQHNKAAFYLNRIESSGFKTDPVHDGTLYKTLAQQEVTVGSFDTIKILELVKKSNQQFSKVEIVTASMDVKVAENYEFLGDMFFARNNFNRANEYYNLGIEKLGFTTNINEPKLISNKGIVIRLLGKIITNEILLNNKDEVANTQANLLNIIKHLSIENTNASTLDFWANHNQKIFEDILEFNFKEKNYKDVFRIIEQNKSNLLIKDIKENESAGFANLDQALIEKGTELKAELAYCDSQIRSIGLSENVDSTKLRSWKNSKNNYQIEYDNYLRDLENNYPEYFDMKYNLEDIRLSSVQEQIDRESILLEYFIGEKKGYVALVSESDLQIYELGDIEKLKELSIDYYQELSQNQTASTTEVSAVLYKHLRLHRVKELYPEAESIVIIADDFLNNIPFGLLQSEEGSLLIENYNIQYQYSARLWQMLKSRKQKTKANDFVGYAYNKKGMAYASDRSCFEVNPSNLRCARKEVRSVIDIIGEAKSVNSQSTMLDLVKDAGNTKILHLATHACLDEENSDYSRIYFNDTLLTNQDLKNKDLSAELVVLSACETGFGEIIKGEGSMSLSKGFFHAGAKSTVVSLWPVDDCATSELMQYFYKNLKAGQTKDAALRQAKLEYRESVSADKAHPYYWAGFIVIGDCAPIWGSGFNLPMILLVGILTGIILFVFLSRKRIVISRK